MNTFAAPPVAVLAHYRPASDGVRWVPAAGGFSGASVWRGDTDGRPVFALKSWPGHFAERLPLIHSQLRKAAHLPFVPRVVPTTTGSTVVSEAGAVWDVTAWLPGEPLAEPMVAEVAVACEAVARLHACWPVGAVRPCPAVATRLQVLAQRADILADGRAFAGVPGELADLLRRGAVAVMRHAPACEAALRPWAGRALPLRPCVRDLRGEHVLFTSGSVTGIVDYGAMAGDHIAADLARLLGDLAGEDDARFSSGLSAYRAAGGVLDEGEGLVRALDRGGTLGSILGWFLRLSVARELAADFSAVHSRLTRLMSRAEGFRFV